MAKHVFGYYDPPKHKKGEVGSYQDVQECFYLVGKLEEAP